MIAIEFHDLYTIITVVSYPIAIWVYRDYLR